MVIFGDTIIMSILKIIRNSYVALSAYIIVVIGSTNLKLSEMIPALILMWTSYLVFGAGYLSFGAKDLKKPMSQPTAIDSWLSKRTKTELTMIAILTVVFSIIVARYYTGQSPVMVLRNLVSGQSVYYEYQRYFKEAEIATFSVAKLPYIAMNFFSKLVFFYSFIAFTISKTHTSKFEKIYLVVIATSFLYVGIARGTNFEIFQFVVLMAFILFTNWNISDNSKAKLRRIVLMVLILSIATFVFYASVLARGVTYDYRISYDVYYDTDSLVHELLPFMSFITIGLFSYFGFGLFYLARFIGDFWFASTESFFAGFFPLGFNLIGESNIRYSMNRIVDMGARWHPDAALFIEDFGYLGLLFICFMLGIIAKRILVTPRKTAITQLAVFFILLQMVSLPIGNLVFVSSSLQLIVLLIIFYWLSKKVKRLLAYKSLKSI